MFRNRYIDRLRGASVLAVIALHCNLGYNFIWPPRLFPFANGYYGVVIFFTISGFLIMGNTLRRYGEPAGINIGQFYTMRVARIMPPLLLFIGAALIAGHMAIGPFAPPSLATLYSAAAYALTFQYNSYYFIANVPGMQHWSPLWSLSIEEMFYIAFPFVCLLTRRPGVLVLIGCVLVIIGPLVRSHFAGVYSVWGAVDLLAIGCMTAIAAKTFDLSSRTRDVLRWIGCTIIGAVFYFGSYSATGVVFTPTVMATGAGLFLSGSAETERNWFFLPLEAFGRASYEIYIFHFGIYFALNHFGYLPWVVSLGFSPLASEVLRSAVVLAVLLAFGTVMSKCFSEPLNRLIRSRLDDVQSVAHRARPLRVHEPETAGITKIRADEVEVRG